MDVKTKKQVIDKLKTTALLVENSKDYAFANQLSSLKVTCRLICMQTESILALIEEIEESEGGGSV